MKITNIIIGVGMLLVTAGMILVLTRGWKVNGQQILDPTYFQGEAEIGHALARRFYVDLRDTQFVVVATSPHLKNGALVWKEFIKAAQVDGLKFDQVYSINGLPQITGSDQFITDLNEVKTIGKVLVQIPSDDFWLGKLRQQFPEATAVYFQTPFVLSAKDLDLNPLKCPDGGDQQTLGCYAKTATTRYYRHRLTDNKLAAAMDKIAGKLNLLFVAEPR